MKNRSGVFVHEAWPSSSLQKYPPISAPGCSGRGGKGPGSLASCGPFPALSAGCGAEQLGNQASGMARGASLGSWICLLGLLPIRCPRILREQTTDSETKGINRDFDII